MANETGMFSHAATIHKYDGEVTADQHAAGEAEPSEVLEVDPAAQTVTRTRRGQPPETFTFEQWKEIDPDGN